MGLLGRMARRGTKTGGKSSYEEQVLRQSKLDAETLASMREQLRKIYNSVYAWWRLKPEQKAELDFMRDRGFFGGTPGRAPYMWIQEGTHNPKGASGAGIHPTQFISKALAEVENEVADAITRAISGVQ